MALKPEQEAAQATMKLQAANIFFDSRMSDHQASLLVGTPRELEEARLGAVAALEALLDAKTFHHRIFMRLNGMEGEDA